MLEKISHNTEVENNAEVKKRTVIQESISKPKRESSSVIMNFLKRIRDDFRHAISSQPKNSSDALVKKMKNELASVEKLATRDGVNFAKCQIGRIVEAYKNGEEVEFEALSPYLSDYNTATGEIWADKLTKADAIGLAVSGLLRKEFPKARLISLYDEYNSDMPDSSDFFGAPTKQTQSSAVTKNSRRENIDAPQISFPDKTKENFKSSLKNILKLGGAIGEDEIEGKNYLLVSESSKIESAEKLTKKLEQHGNIRREGQAIYFVNPDSENPAYREITLRTPNGRWLCEALDASSYLDEKNLKITHLVVLPNEFIDQQDKVWEILRTLGITPTNYHNIFYDKNVPPDKVVRVIRDEIRSYAGD